MGSFRFKDCEESGKSLIFDLNSGLKFDYGSK